MAYETIQVTVSRDSTLTIEEFVEECKKKYGWKDAFYRTTDGFITFTDAEGIVQKMDTNGEVYDLDAEGEAGYLVEVKDLADDFDWTQHLWADDGEGNPILIYKL